MIGPLLVLGVYVMISGYMNIKFIKTLNNHAEVITSQQIKIKQLENKLYGFGE